MTQAGSVSQNSPDLEGAQQPRDTVPGQPQPVYVWCLHQCGERSYTDKPSLFRSICRSPAPLFQFLRAGGLTRPSSSVSPGLTGLRCSTLTPANCPLSAGGLWGQDHKSAPLHIRIYLSTSSFRARFLIPLSSVSILATLAECS